MASSSEDEYDEGDDAFVTHLSLMTHLSPKKKKDGKDPPRQRATRTSAVQMLEKKYEQRAACNKRKRTRATTKRT